MENSPPTNDGDLPEGTTEDFRPDYTPPWPAEPESADRKRDLKERYFLTRKELRDAQRLLALRDEELRKLRLTDRRQVEQNHEEENLKSSMTRLQSRVDELQRQLTESRNQLRLARTEAAERSAMAPLLEKENAELREQLEQGEGRLGEITSLLEQREGELRDKNGSLHEASELSDRLDQRERDLLEREEELHGVREQLGTLRGEIQAARRTAETVTGERDELAGRLSRVEASTRNSEDTINMLQEKLMESGEELIKLEESVRDYRYLMEVLKREKSEQETASSRTVDELEKRIEASGNECQGLQELLKARQRDQEKVIAEKDEMAAHLVRSAESHRDAITSLNEAQTGKIDELQAESTRELTGVLQAHAQEIDKLKMMHAGEMGEAREAADRQRIDLEMARERSGRLQLELDKAHQSAGRLQSELDEARQGIPRLVARIEEREQAITETRTLLVDTLTRLEGLDQPPELDLGQELPAEQAKDGEWPTHQTFGEFLDGIEDPAATRDEPTAPGDFPPTTSLP